MKINLPGLLGVLLICCFLGGCTGVGAWLEGVTAPFVSPVVRLTREGSRLEAEGRIAEAILAYRGVLAQDEHNLAAMLRLADLFAGQGRRRSARLLLDKALRQRPEDVSIKNKLSQIDVSPQTSGPLRLVWQVRIGESTPLGMALSGEQVFITLDNGQAAALEIASGRVIWQLKLPAPAASAPAVQDGYIFIGAEDGRLYALSAADGTQRWNFSSQGPIYARPAVSGAVVYAPSSDGSLYALQRDTGAFIWRVSTPGALHAPPAVANEVVYFGSLDTRLYAMAAATGQPIWQPGFLTQGAIETEPVVFDNRVLFGSDDGRAYALAADSGGEFWRYSTSDAIFARPLVQADTVYLASSGGSLAALDLVSGKAFWTLRTEGSIVSTPVLLGETLYYSSLADPHLFAVQAADGKPLWKLDTGDWITGEILAAGELLLAGGKDGTLLAYSGGK